MLSVRASILLLLISETKNTKFQYFFFKFSIIKKHFSVIFVRVSHDFEINSSFLRGQRTVMYPTYTHTRTYNIQIQINYNVMGKIRNQEEISRFTAKKKIFKKLFTHNNNKKHFSKLNLIEETKS